MVGKNGTFTYHIKSWHFKYKRIQCILALCWSNGLVWIQKRECHIQNLQLFFLNFLGFSLKSFFYLLPMRAKETTVCDWSISTKLKPRT